MEWYCCPQLRHAHFHIGQIRLNCAKLFTTSVIGNNVAQRHGTSGGGTGAGGRRKVGGLVDDFLLDLKQVV